jgi:hypothetical protein
VLVRRRVVELVPEEAHGLTAHVDPWLVVRTMKLLGAHSLEELEPRHVTQLERLVPRARS